MGNMNGDEMFEVARVWISCTNLFKIPLYFIPMLGSINHLLDFKPGPIAKLVESLALYAIIFTLAVLLASVSKVLGLVGSTTGAVLMFVVPALCYLHAPRRLQEDPRELGSTIGPPSPQFRRLSRSHSSFSASSGSTTSEAATPLQPEEGPPAHRALWLPIYLMLASGIGVVGACVVYTLIYWKES